MSIISNTTVLVNFAEIGQIAVLPAIFGTIFLPTEVYAELQDGAADGYRFLEPLLAQVSPPADQGWLQQTTLADAHELRMMSILPVGLHRGEAACLAIAAQRSWLLLTDDRAARAEARRRAIRFSGSIGCLVRAVERGVAPLADANAWLAAMIANGYYAPVTDLTPLVLPKHS
jgi:predicted nucleic acid-binding protein